MILEKMLMRLRDGTQREWRTIAGVLPHLKYTDKMLAKIIEMYELWKERMLDSSTDVRDAFYQVVQNVKKAQVGTSAKDLKPKLDEIQKMVDQSSGANAGKSGNVSGDHSAANSAMKEIRPEHFV